MKIRLLLVFPLIAWTSVGTVQAREWVDASGKYRFEGDLIAHDDTMVILEKDNKELVSIDIAQLSEADREHIAQQAEKAEGNQEMRTWTTRQGLKVRAAFVEYVNRPITFRRHRGKAYINDKKFDNLPGVYRQIAPRFVAHFEGIEPDEKSFQKWIKDLRGQKKTFTLEGALMELENGDHYAFPFFLLSNEDRAFLMPDYERWLKAKEDKEARQLYSMSARARAVADRRAQAEQQKVMKMHLMLKAVDSGVTSLWEVTLYPPNNMGIARTVVVPARDSQQAMSAALSKFPGFRVGPIRKVSD